MVANHRLGPAAIVNKDNVQVESRLLGSVMALINTMPASTPRERRAERIQCRVILKGLDKAD